MSTYSFLRVYLGYYLIKMRPSEFTRAWWIWLCLTGASLGATISCKMVGLFTFFTVGSAVIIDLGSILGLRLNTWRQSNLQTVRAPPSLSASTISCVLCRPDSPSTLAQECSGSLSSPPSYI